MKREFFRFGIQSFSFVSIQRYVPVYTHIYLHWFCLFSFICRNSFVRSKLFNIHGTRLVIGGYGYFFNVLYTHGYLLCFVSSFFLFITNQANAVLLCMTCYLLYSVHCTLELDKQIEIKRFETTHKKCVHAHSIQIMSKQFKLFHFLLNNNAAHILFTRIACVTYWVKTKMKSTEKKWQTKRNIYAA